MKDAVWTRDKTFIDEVVILWNQQQERKIWNL